MNALDDQTRANGAWRRYERSNRYQLTIGAKPKFVWFRNAKVGTRTTLNSFRSVAVEFEMEQEFDRTFNPGKYRDHFKFAFVRNPWARVVSGWRNKILRNSRGSFRLTEEEREKFQDFEAFVEFVAAKELSNVDIHFRPQHLLINLNAIDYLGRLETLDHDLREIFGILGLEQPEVVPRRNKSGNDEPYQSYYNERTRAMVLDLYRKDIQLFGYSFDDK